MTLILKTVGKMFHEPNSAAFQALWHEHARQVKEHAAKGESDQQLQQKTCVRLTKVLHEPRYEALRNKVGPLPACDSHPKLR